MTVTVYGQSASRAIRALWMVEELGIDYDHQPVRFKDAGADETLRSLNAYARVPTIDDGGLAVSESMAINLHLAERYGGDLKPKDATEAAGALQWSFFVMTEIEKTLLNALAYRLGLFGLDADPVKADRLGASLAPAFAVLEHTLDKQDYLLGGRFTVADLNVASVLLWVRQGKIDVTAHPALDEWLKRCLARDQRCIGRRRYLRRPVP